MASGASFAAGDAAREGQTGLSSSSRDSGPYITRAPERHDARRRLYQEVVALLHRKPDQGAGAA